MNKEQVLAEIAQLKAKSENKSISPEYLGGVLEHLVSNMWVENVTDTVTSDTTTLFFSRTGDIVIVSIVNSDGRSVGGQTIEGLNIPTSFRPENDFISRDFTVKNDGEMKYRISKVEPDGKFLATFVYNIKQPAVG